MFGIEWSEYIVIAVVALIVIGPKELPAVLRAIGQWTAKVRRMAAEFQSQFQEAMREAEMADLKKEVDNLSAQAKGFTSQFDDPLNFQEATKWEPKSEATSERTPAPVSEPKLELAAGQPDDAAKLSAAPPEPAPVSPGEGTAAAAGQPAIEHTATEIAAVPGTAPAPPEASGAKGDEAVRA
jgi:sec-independent protein translocase protein TatB